MQLAQKVVEGEQTVKETRQTAGGKKKAKAASSQPPALLADLELLARKTANLSPAKGLSAAQRQEAKEKVRQVVEQLERLAAAL